MSILASNRNTALLLMATTLILLIVSMPGASAAPVPTTFTSPNAQSGGLFGTSVAVSGSTVVVGAPLENAGGTYQAGQVYIFNTSGTLLATLTSPNPVYGGSFGSSVAVSGTTVVVGALLESAGGTLRAGQAYIFNTTGTLIATLTSPNPISDGDFGWAVAVSRTSVVVGAPLENVVGVGPGAAGHAYIFSTAGRLIATLTSPNPESNERFGWTVAASSTRVVVGAPFEHVAGFVSAGHAYIFSRTGHLITTLTSPNPETNGNFGMAVAISRTNIVVGAPEENAGGALQSGRAYTFSKTGRLIATLISPNPIIYGSFGSSVALSGPNIVVDAPFEPGHAYIFSAAGVLTATLTNPTARAFGSRLAANGTTVIVGAPEDPANGLLNAGQAYLFQV